MDGTRTFRLVSWTTLALVLSTTMLVVVTGSGCTSMMAGMMYAIKGHKIDAEYDGLRNKRVAIVCRPMVEMQYSGGSTSNEVSKQLGALLTKNLRRVSVIDHTRISEWTDENDWNDFTEIGRAVDADMVIGIDLERLDLYRGQTLYQGNAKVVLRVYDMRDGGAIVYQRDVPQVVYPPNAGIATSEMPADEFRRTFVRVLADQIGRHFYAHDATADFARDAEML